MAPICSPTTPSRGCDRGSTIVTLAPCCRAAAAASQPIQPAPTITTLAPSVNRSRSARDSSSVRSVSRPSSSEPCTSSRRGAEPVAMSNLSYGYS